MIRFIYSHTPDMVVYKSFIDNNFRQITKSSMVQVLVSGISLNFEK